MIEHKMTYLRGLNSFNPDQYMFMPREFIQFTVYFIIGRFR